MEPTDNDFASAANYDAAAARLMSRLERFGIVAPPANKLSEALAEVFEAADFRYAYRLIHGVPSRPWYLLSLAEHADRLYWDNETDIIAPAEDALGWLLQHIDLYRLAPTSFLATAEGVEILSRDGLIARIGPIHFAPVNIPARDRVHRALRGLRRNSDTNRWFARLATIPGLVNIADMREQIRLGGHGKSYSSPPPERGAPGAFVIRTTSNLCLAVRTLLHERFAITVNQSQAQELTAAVFDAANWQQLVARDDDDCCWLRPVSIDELDHTLKSKSFRFYRSAGEAIWAFAQMVRAHRADNVKAYYRDADPEEHVPYLTTSLYSSASFSCEVLPEVRAAEPFRSRAREMLAAPSGLAEQLREYFAAPTGASWQWRTVASNRRLDIRGEWVRGRLFTVQMNDGRRVFCAERFGERGEQTGLEMCNAENARLEIKTTAAANPWIDSPDNTHPDTDYGILLDGLTDAEVARVCKFFSIALDPVIISPSSDEELA